MVFGVVVVWGCPVGLFATSQQPGPTSGVEGGVARFPHPLTGKAFGVPSEVPLLPSLNGSGIQGGYIIGGASGVDAHNFHPPTFTR